MGLKCKMNTSSQKTFWLQQHMKVGWGSLTTREFLLSFGRAKSSVGILMCKKVFDYTAQQFGGFRITEYCGVRVVHNGCLCWCNVFHVDCDFWPLIFAFITVVWRLTATMILHRMYRLNSAMSQDWEFRTKHVKALVKMAAIDILKT